MSLEFPPRKDSTRFDDWMLLLWKKVNTPDSGTTETNHAALGNLNSTTYSHLTKNQVTDLTDFGDSQLHYHALDRDRSNHTGTQPSTSIVDFVPSVQSLLSAWPVSRKTTTYTILPTDLTILCDTSSAGFTVTLEAAPTDGRIVNVKKITTDGNTLTIARNGNNIEGAAANLTTALTTRPNFQLQYELANTTWWVL